MATAALRRLRCLSPVVVVACSERLKFRLNLPGQLALLYQRRPASGSGLNLDGRLLPLLLPVAALRLVQLLPEHLEVARHHTGAHKPRALLGAQVVQPLRTWVGLAGGWGRCALARAGEGRVARTSDSISASLPRRECPPWRGGSRCCRTHRSQPALNTYSGLGVRCLC